MLTIESDKFFEALKSGDLARVSELIDKHPSLVDAKTRSGATGILFALYSGHPGIAELIAQRKPTIDIFEAASLGKIPQAEELANHNSELVRAYSDEGFTALQLASYLGQVDAVNLLLKSGAEVNAVAKNPSGFTALTGAVSRGHVNIAQRLLEEGANPNHRYEDGFTPLMEAAASGYLEIAKLLLVHGADTKIRKDGKTARDFAREKGRTDVGELLEWSEMASKT